MVRTRARGEAIWDGTVREVDIDFGLDPGDVNAQVIPVDTSSFNNNLSASDNKVQIALDTIDDLDFGGIADEARIAQDFEDFTHGTTLSGTIGKWGWTAFNISRRSKIEKADPEDRAGVLKLESKNNSNSGITLSTSSKDNFRSHADIAYRTAIKTGSIITNTVYRFGFHDERNKIIKPINGLYFQYDTSVSPNWQICTAKSGVRTETITTTPVAVDTWYKLEMAVNDTNTAAEFKIDRVVVGTINTNLPTDPGENFTYALTMFTLNNTKKHFYIDYYWAYMPLLNR